MFRLALFIVLASTVAAHAGDRVKTTGSNYGGSGSGCKGPACGVKVPTTGTNRAPHCYTVGPPPGGGGRAYTKCD